MTERQVEIEEFSSDKSCFPDLTLNKRRLSFYIFFVIFLVFICISWGILIGVGTTATMTFFYLISMVSFWISTIFFYKISYQIETIKNNVVMIILPIVNLVSIILQILNLYIFKVSILSFIFIGSGTSCAIIYFCIGFPLVKTFFCCCDGNASNSNNEETPVTPGQNLV